MKNLILILMVVLIPQTMFSQSEYTDYQIAMWICKTRPDIQPDYYMNTDFDCRVDIHYPNLIEDFNDMHDGLVYVTNFTPRQCLILAALFVHGGRERLIDFLLEDIPFNNILVSIDDDYTRGLVLEYVNHWLHDSSISKIREHVTNKNQMAWRLFQDEKCGTRDAKWVNMTDKGIY